MNYHVLSLLEVYRGLAWYSTSQVTQYKGGGFVGERVNDLTQALGVVQSLPHVYFFSSHTSVAHVRFLYKLTIQGVVTDSQQAKADDSHNIGYTMKCERRK